MQPFERVTGAAAPLLNDDINTDQISPALQNFKPDYAESLFARWRRSPNCSCWMNPSPRWTRSRATA